MNVADTLEAIWGEPKSPTAPPAKRLTLPYPPSANTLYRTIIKGRRAIPIKSAEHRAFFSAVAQAFPAHAGKWDGPLAVTLRLYRPRRVGDIDGPIKALLDSLNGLAWEDDSQIVALYVSRGDDKHRPRVEVEIHPIHNAVTNEES